MKQLLSLLVLASVLRAASAPVPPPDKLLPADTVAVFTVTDYKKARADWNRWPALQFWNDAAMKPFREKLMTSLKKDLVEPLEREFGIKFADYKDLCQGQVTLAFTPGAPNEKGERQSGFLFLVDTRDKADVLKTNLATLKQKWVESGKAVKPEKIRDIEFTTLLFSGDDLTKTVEKVLPSPKKKEQDEPEEKKPAKKREWLVGQSDSLLIIASSAKDVEKVLIRQSGGAVPSLAEHRLFAANYGTLFRETSTYAWADLKTMLDFTPRKPADAGAEAEPAAMDMTKMLSALGLNALQSFAFSLKDSNEGCLATFSVTAPESSRRGLARIFSYEPRDASPPPFVPADAVKFTRWRIDLAKAFASLEAMLVEMNPAYAGIIKLFVDNAGKDKDPTFDLRKNLIANLGDDVIAYEKKPKDSTLAGKENAPTLYLISSPRAEQMAAAIKALTAFVPQPSRFKEREFLGRKVYSINLPPTGAAGAGGPGGAGANLASPRVLSYAASGSYVVFSTDTPLLEEYLRANEARALRETPGLAPAAERVGGMGTGLFGFENQKESMRAVFEALKKDSASIEDLLSGSRLGGRLNTEEDKKFKGWFDFALLPNYDQVSKYFHVVVWSGAVTSDGFTFRWFTPTPPGTK